MFKISIQELQALLNYLQKKPYIETAALIAMIQKLESMDKKIESVDKKKEDKPRKLVM